MVLGRVNWNILDEPQGLDWSGMILSRLPLITMSFNPDWLLYLSIDSTMRELSRIGSSELVRVNVGVHGIESLFYLMRMYINIINLEHAVS